MLGRQPLSLPISLLHLCGKLTWSSGLPRSGFKLISTKWHWSHSRSSWQAWYASNVTYAVLFFTYIFQNLFLTLASWVLFKEWNFISGLVFRVAPKHSCEVGKMFLWPSVLQGQIRVSRSSTVASDFQGRRWSFIMIVLPAEHGCSEKLVFIQRSRQPRQRWNRKLFPVLARGTWSLGGSMREQEKHIWNQTDVGLNLDFASY